MLNQHENLVVPKSDHLRIGDCVVDIARREVQAPGAEAPRRITVKALQVLLVLVAHHGKVVSREALLEWVWSGTLPGDDVLTQAVTQLRKAFGDERDAPRYLETIAKGGYRLLADVAWLPTQRAGEVPMTASGPQPTVADPDAQAHEAATSKPPGESAAPAPMPRRNGIKTVAVAAAACLAMLVVFAGFAWRGSRSPQSAAAKPAGSHPAGAQVPALAFSVVASQPGLETMPSLSPDGSQLAYAMSPVAQGDEAMAGESIGKAIYVQTTAAVAPRRLTEPPAGMRDGAPRWSPDGREILFLRASENGGCDLLVVAASGGTPWQAGPCLLQSTGMYDWLADGSGIIAGGMRKATDKDIRLQILSLKTGEWRQLAYQAKPGDVDIDPRVSPDGKWIVFRRNISNSDFWRVALAGGAPERLTHLQGNVWGWDFMPDGKSIVFSYLRNNASLYRYDFASKQVTPLGIDNGQYPDIAARAPVMAFEITDQQTGLFRRAAPLDPKSEPARRLFESSGSDLMPSVSPDGARIAFYSDRTRELRLWFGNADGSGAPALVEDFIPIQRQPVRWMEDGNTVFSIGYEPKDAGADAVPALFAIDLRSGRVRRQVLPSGLVPVSLSLLPRQRVLMVADMGDGRLSMRVLDAAATPWRELARRDAVGEARYDPASDAVWYVRTDVPGLWRTDVALASQANVDREQPWVYWMRLWMLAQGQPYSVQASEDCAMALRSLSASRPIYCLEREVRYAYGEPVLTRDAGWLYFSASVRPENIDIGTVKLR
ncbi:MAG: hypothetical protein EOP93_06465 [Lysobacteraceae bacterium]|nr:MAG: hypothetical protein EOP93_06465 [Xanthomonadaceae bacterium]